MAGKMVDENEVGTRDFFRRRWSWRRKSAPLALENNALDSNAISLQYTAPRSTTGEPTNRRWL